MADLITPEIPVTFLKNENSLSKNLRAEPDKAAWILGHTQREIVMEVSENSLVQPSTAYCCFVVK